MSHGQITLCCACNETSSTGQASGLIAINKQDTDTYNRAGGFDFAYRPTDSLDFRGMWASTFEDDASGENNAWYLDGNWQNNRFRLRGAYTAIDENFNPEVGFVRRRGVRQIHGDVGYTGWPRRYGIRRIRVAPEVDYILNQDNELETRKILLTNSFMLESRDTISFKPNETLNISTRILKSGRESSSQLANTISTPLGGQVLPILVGGLPANLV